MSFIGMGKPTCEIIFVLIVSISFTLFTIGWARKIIADYKITEYRWFIITFAVILIFILGIETKFDKLKKLGIGRFK